MRWNSHGPVALIGDAAFCPSLLAGQGAALAMISVYVPSRKLSKSEGIAKRATYLPGTA